MKKKIAAFMLSLQEQAQAEQTDQREFMVWLLTALLSLAAYLWRLYVPQGRENFEQACALAAKDEWDGGQE